MTNYYPLSPGNEWHYAEKQGAKYYNRITKANGHDFFMHNDTLDTTSILRVNGDWLLTDVMEAGNFQPWLKNNAQPGDTWEMKFRTSGLDYVMVKVMTVKSIGGSIAADGKTFNNVMMVETENKIVIVGNLTSMDYFTQYYYADGIGLILTTSSAGDEHRLISYTVR